jgi:hypothetical protein
MRLSNAQVRDVLGQVDDAVVVPPESPAVPQLESVFGLHTFFLRQSGLHVVERGEAPAPASETAFVVRVADWADDRHTRLAPSRPQVSKSVDIGPKLADLPCTEPESDEQDLLGGHGDGSPPR